MADPVATILSDLFDAIDRIALDCTDAATREALQHYIKKARDDYNALGLTPDPQKTTAPPPNKTAAPPPASPQGGAPPPPKSAKSPA